MPACADGHDNKVVAVPHELRCRWSASCRHGSPNIDWIDCWMRCTLARQEQLTMPALMR